MDVVDDPIPEAEYAHCQRYLPEACVELFLESDGTGSSVSGRRPSGERPELEGGVLLARRTNEPAQGEWFWPGSRLYKGEELDAAARRVGREELGIEVDLTGRLGVYSHFWATSGVEGVDTRHTVNVVFRATPARVDYEIRLDDQHDAYRFVSAPEPEFHEYVRRYLQDAGYARG